MTHRQPIFNAPGVVVGILLAFVAVHVVRELLPEETSDWLTALLAFIPSRLGASAPDLPGGRAAAVTQFATHLFVHGDVTHLIVNSAWFLAFGSSVARRTGTPRFLAFFLLCGAAGAAFYVAVNGTELNLLVGASGAISGLMGAALRFLLQPMSEGDLGGIAGRTHHPPLMSLGAMLRDRRAVAVVAAWTLLNVVLAWGAGGLVTGMSIAWEAHVGGFFAGLLVYGAFDHPPPIDDERA